MTFVNRARENCLISDLEKIKFIVDLKRFGRHLG